MSIEDDYKQELKALRAIPAKRVTRPKLPITVSAQEAENLYRWARKDRRALEGSGLPWEMVTSLPSRAGALRYLEAVWTETREAQRDAEKAWRAAQRKGRVLRIELLAAYRLAFRKDPYMMRRMAQFTKKGLTQAKLIQQLSDLALIGEEHANLLKKIRFRKEMVLEAASLSARLGDLRALSRGDAEWIEAKELRDRAYHHLKEAVEEVRAFGRYVFRKSPKRAKGYASDYWRRKRRARAKASSGNGRLTAGRRHQPTNKGLATK